MFDDPGRRQFLKLMGASLLLGGLTGCDDETRSDQALPYVNQPDDIVPGVAALLRDRRAVRGLRPAGASPRPMPAARPSSTAIRIIRSTAAPAIAFMQSAIFGLYDPERSKMPSRRRRAVDLGRVRRRARWRCARAGANAGRRPAHPHRRHDLADADPADGGAGQAISQDALAPLRAGRHGSARTRR